MISRNYASSRDDYLKTIFTSEGTKHGCIFLNLVGSLSQYSPLLLTSVQDELALIFTGTRASLAQKTPKTVEMIDESQESPSDDSMPPTPELENLQHRQPDPSKDLTPHPNVAIHPNLLKPLAIHLPHPLFVIDQLGVDRRLLVNRKRQLKMYRVWMQGRFKKQDSNES